MSETKLDRYYKKRQKVLNLLKSLEIHYEYLANKDLLSAQGFDNDNEIAEKIMEILGHNKPAG